MSKKWISPVATLSYPNIATPQAPKQDKNGNPIGKPKYTAAFLFDGNDAEVAAAIAEGKKAVLEAAEEVFVTKAAAMLKSGALKQPFRTDAEAKGYAEGTIFLNARTEYKPGVVYSWPDPETGKAMKIKDEDIEKQLYAGSKVRVSLTAYYYDVEGSKGITFGMGNIQKIGDGPRLDNRKAAEDEFDADATLTPADLASLEG